MHPDHAEYFTFTSRARFDKAVNTLLGIVEGLAMDGVVTADENRYLRGWLEDHVELRERHPFNEFIPVITEMLSVGVLDPEAREDIRWLCQRLLSTGYYDRATADLQRLHAIVASIVADGEITESELRGLAAWLEDHAELRSCWPYDELDSLITAVLADGRIDAHEHRLLVAFFAEFLPTEWRTIVNPPVLQGETITGLCAVCPEIRFDGTRFCFTGASSRYPRTKLIKTVEQLGGSVVSSISAKLDYLIIGGDGNPCWSYACYGRKVEKAVELRKAGARLLIVHEADFHDALADQ